MIFSTSLVVPGFNEFLAEQAVIRFLRWCAGIDDSRRGLCICGSGQ
jgi:hypothetical protein